MVIKMDVVASLDTSNSIVALRQHVKNSRMELSVSATATSTLVSALCESLCCSVSGPESSKP
jgi:hypothetical protein